MNRSISLIIVATLVYIASLSAFAAGVHKWVDENGVTHYSDEAPTSSATQVTFIEVPATYSTAANVENEYYSITNQWMRLHKERIAREKIKLEKAKQKAAQRPAVPQELYLNEPYEDRYIVGYPNFIHRSHGRDRFHHKSRRDHSGKRAKHHRSGHSDRFRGQGLRHKSNSHRNSSGVTLKIH